MPVAAFIVAFTVGRFPITLFDLYCVFDHVIFGAKTTIADNVQTVILTIRLPRILGAMLVGGALALSGSCYQGVFRNPLVSPFTLGVSAGAGFGAALAILFFYTSWSVPVGAFVFSLIAVFGCFAISKFYRARNTLVLILSGIIIGSVFTALLALLKYTADPFSKLPVIEFWLLGSLSSIGNSDVIVIAVMIAPSAVVLLLLRWKLNILALGDEKARQLGVNPRYYRLIVILAATLVAAAAVSVSGIIGWVGLVIPHLARIVTGPDFRKLLPVSISFGACFLLLIDSLSRTLTTGEIPLGIITALIGAPLFFVLLGRNRLGWVI